VPRVASLQPVVSYDSLLRAPLGAYFAGRHLLVWCVDETLLGVTLWGRPAPEDVSRLLELLDFPHHPALARGCNVVFDASRVEAIDPEVFEAYLTGLARRRVALSERVRRQALIRPPGLVGAIVGGVGFVLDAPTPWSVFTCLEPALVWLARSDATSLAEMLDELACTFCQREPVVGLLRAMLRALPYRVRLDEAGRRLGLAPRSLQRLLRANGTSFRAEVDRERLALAGRLLVESDDKLEAIARRIGCCSAAHLSAFYRRHTGITPTAFRQSRRRCAELPPVTVHGTRLRPRSGR
jgi:AraC-like DNA-binding protein